MADLKQAQYIGPSAKSQKFFEIGYFTDGVWCAHEKASSYVEAIEKQAMLAYFHKRDWTIVQVNVKTTRKKM